MGFLRAFLVRALEKQNRAALIELCERGLLTCTRGEPGDDDATYALGWLPLDNPDEYSAEVRARHAANLQKFDQAEGS